MTTKTRNGKLFLTVVILIICLVGLAVSSMSKYNTAAFAEERCEDKVYCKTTINEDFTDDCVLVVMDKFHSKLNQKIGIEFFNGLPIKSVSDLMAMDKDEKELEFLNTEDFRQVLKLELEEPSKQNVLDVIHSLEQMKGILSASPSHAFQQY